jgi:hypothetical protein
MMLSFWHRSSNLPPRPWWAAHKGRVGHILKAGVVIMGSLASFAEIGKIDKPVC